MLSLFSLLLTSLSCVALAGCLWSWFRVRKLLQGASPRSLAQCSTELAELMSAFESLSAGHRKLAARVGMREVRQKGEEQRESKPSESIGTKIVDRSKLKEIARERGHDVS